MCDGNLRNRNENCASKWPAKLIDRREARDSRLYDSLLQEREGHFVSTLSSSFRVPRFLTALIIYRIPWHKTRDVVCLLAIFSRFSSQSRFRARNERSVAGDARRGSVACCSLSDVTSFVKN